MYLRGVETKFSRPERNQDIGGNERTQQLPVFQRTGRPLGKKEIIILELELCRKSEWYVLNNSGPQIQSYLE